MRSYQRHEQQARKTIKNKGRPIEIPEVYGYSARYATKSHKNGEGDKDEDDDDDEDDDEDEDEKYKREEWTGEKVTRVDEKERKELTGMKGRPHPATEMKDEMDVWSGTEWKLPEEIEGMDRNEPQAASHMETGGKERISTLGLENETRNDPTRSRGIRVPTLSSDLIEEETRWGCEDYWSNLMKGRDECPPPKHNPTLVSRGVLNHFDEPDTRSEGPRANFEQRMDPGSSE